MRPRSCHPLVTLAIEAALDGRELPDDTVRTIELVRYERLAGRLAVERAEVAAGLGDRALIAALARLAHLRRAWVRLRYPDTVEVLPTALAVWIDDEPEDPRADPHEGPERAPPELPATAPARLAGLLVIAPGAPSRRLAA